MIQNLTIDGYFADPTIIKDVAVGGEIWGGVSKNPLEP